MEGQIRVISYTWHFIYIYFYHFIKSCDIVLYVPVWSLLWRVFNMQYIVWLSTTNLTNLSLVYSSILVEFSILSLQKKLTRSPPKRYCPARWIWLKVVSIDKSPLLRLYNRQNKTILGLMFTAQVGKLPKLMFHAPLPIILWRKKRAQTELCALTTVRGMRGTLEGLSQDGGQGAESAKKIYAPLP
jgi:hypothetical protein